MLNKGLLFLLLLVLLLHIFPSYLSQLTLSHLLSPCTHSCPLTHTSSLTCTLPYVPSTRAPVAQAQIFLGSWPQVSLTPLPAPSLPHACSQSAFTLPTTPTFIPVHKQAPTCLPLHSSPSTHRHISFCSHFPGLKHARIPVQAHSLTHRHVLSPLSSYLDHKTGTHTPKQPQCMPQYLHWSIPCQ